MFNTSEIHISRKALKHNLEFLREKILHKNVRYSSVVKGNAYGHGIEEFVPQAENFGVDHFSVFNANEAWRVHKLVKDDTDVMIMGMIDDPEVEWAVEYGIEFFVFDFKRLDSAIHFARQCSKKACIHLEVETGLNRTGFNAKNLEKALELIKKNEEHIELRGICTHLAGAESSTNYLRIQNQIKAYKEAVEQVEKSGLKAKYHHAVCSAGCFFYPEMQMNMVRVGIAQYGLWPSAETKIQYLKKIDDKSVDPLKRVISWKSRVMSTKKVESGEFIGYGTTFLATQDMLLATIPVGYANGFSRALSNTGRVLIKGIRCSVIGLVNMNMLMIDVSNVEEGVEKGDEVVLIGDQDEHSISLSSFGELSNQLNYELLTRLPLDIPRFIS